MISTLTSLSEARILVVGAGDLVNEILRNFVSNGISDLTALDPSTAPEVDGVQFQKEDPEEYLKQNGDYFKKFHLVVAANQPRPFEVGLSDLRWPKNGSKDDPDLPIIVTRSAANNCKFRCQYRELPLKDSESAKFISLETHLLPTTDEKRTLIASIVQTEFKPKENPSFQAYITAARASIEYHESKGSWPGVGDEDAVQELADRSDHGSKAEVRSYVATLCQGGFSAAQETTAILGRFISTDSIKLLTGSGQPVNNTNLDGIIKP